MTCVTFVWLSAPDLGVTQLLVEIVTTVLLLLGLFPVTALSAQDLFEARTSTFSNTERTPGIPTVLLLQ